MIKDTILYVGNFGFPNKNAAGSRVLANGYILRDLGYNVTFFGTSNKNDNTPINQTFEIHHGFESFQFPYLKRGFNLKQYQNLFEEFIKLIKDRKLEKRLKAIIFYGSPTLSLWVSKLVNWCQKNNILAIEDCVDWLEINHGNFVFKVVKKSDYFYRKVYINQKMDGIICISEFLQDHYTKKNKKTILIPPLTLENSFSAKRKLENESKRIVYAGVPFPPGRLKKREHAKDRLDLAIKYLYLAFKQGADFQFDIYGITEERYLEALPEDDYMLKELKNKVNFYGYQSVEVINENVSKADFTILIRDINRSSTAGFSTKFVQSISLGTPVITTKTSDLSNFLIEDENGYFLDFDENKAISKLVKILSESNEKIFSMKKQCSIKNPFLYQKYINTMEKFLENVSG